MNSLDLSGHASIFKGKQIENAMLNRVPKTQEAECAALGAARP